MMKLTKSFVRRLIALRDGQALPASSLRGQEWESMVQEGVLVPIVHGSRRSLRAMDTGRLMDYVADKFNIIDLQAALCLSQSTESTRAKQVEVTGDSKVVASQVAKGFLASTIEPIETEFFGQRFVVDTPSGISLFVHDYDHLILPADVVVVGIENMENFHKVHQQRRLFSVALPNRRLFFVSRYPQSQHLITWLQSISNEYVHFGDLDLAGIHIFLTEFQAKLGERSRFLVPPDYAERIARGSRKRYNQQLLFVDRVSSSDPVLQQLIDCINREHRGYDQEGYIEG
jgi:hypothetical protein